ncbi:Flp pilus assembly protein TadG [Tepidamorphus gemmatus]|uniref:Flp pilus assembly protein TadG n=1 Tax=Tepidamorphus gemmatus TaxID=747076 RepID=A0A4R3M2K3_9HYPH|nr:TadE/TadG family type IV pilus assembly protein [Tepidamorphus gemmatus]TCT07232.1 Flp pilus assembly protein TadG [Tepidamorphus gemmatus]
MTQAPDQPPYCPPAGLLPHRFLGDERAVSAVEFALILPVLIVLYLGGVELSHTISVDRKVTAVASAVGDLVAQAKSIDNAEMNHIFTAATAIMAPYPVAPLKMVVSSVEVSSKGDKILWSNGYHTAGRAVGSAVSLPAAVRIEGTTLIMSEADYTYTPTLGQIFTESITLSDTFYLRPRSADKVERQ